MDEVLEVVTHLFLVVHGEGVEVVDGFLEFPGFFFSFAHSVRHGEGGFRFISSCSALFDSPDVECFHCFLELY